MLQAQDWSRLKAKTIAFDHHYLTPDVVQSVTQLKLDWVSKAGKDDHGWWQGQWLRLDEILQHLPRHKFKTVWVQTSNGRQRYWVCKQRLRLRTLYQGTPELTVIFSKTSRDATAATYLLSSHDWSARRIVRTYARRWTIETGHKQQKHLLGLTDYQMTRLLSIKRFWLLNLLAYAVLALLRFTRHPLVQKLMTDLRTLGHARQALSLISLLAFVSLIIALVRTYGAEDIVRLRVKGLDPAELALLEQVPPS